jgi:general secretion pathway protein G
MKRPRRGRRGFTLAEMAFVLAIAGLLIAITWPAVERYVERTRILETVVRIGEMSKKIKQHELATGALPDALADVGFGAEVDAWGYPYEYMSRDLKGNGKPRKDKKLKPLNSDFDLYSVGRDGLSQPSLGHAESRDDIVRARDGAFVGTAEEFDP